MKTTERVRQVVSGVLEVENLKQQTEKGWKLVAIEWEREVETAEDQLPADVPFGLQIMPETQRLETNPAEREILVQMMELIVQEGSYARIADEINRRGFRTREGAKWTSVSVFEMIPRLIEVGPHVFRSSEWQQRRRHLTEAARIESVQR
jgi:recombinase